MKRPLSILSALLAVPLLSAQNIIFEEDFTTDLGDAVFGYAWAQNDAGMLWNPDALQVMEDGGRIEFSFDSTNAGGWFGGAVGVAVAIQNLPEVIQLSDLAMEVDLSALGGSDRGRGSVRVTIDFIDEAGTFLKLGAPVRLIGVSETSVAYANLANLDFVVGEDPEPRLTLEAMQAAAAGPIDFNEVIVWLEVGDGPGTFENSSGNSIRLHRVALTTPLDLPEPDPDPDPEPPAAPSDLVAIPSGTDRIDLSWTNNSTNETLLLLEASTDGGVTFGLLVELAAGTAAYAHTGLAASTTLHYRVRAENDDGASEWSNVAMATTEAEHEPIEFPFALTGFEEGQTEGFLSTWLGMVWVSRDVESFIYSADLGWLFFVGTEAALDLYVFADDSWIHTNEQIYPFLFDFAEESWQFVTSEGVAPLP